MAGDETIPLPGPSSGGPTLDAEEYTNQASTTTYRERIASVAGSPTAMQTTIANVSFSAAGTTSVVSAGGGTTTIRIMRLLLTVNLPTNIEFLSAASVIMGPYTLQAGGAIALDDCGEPWMVTGTNVAFQVNSSNAVTGQITVWYTQS